MLRRLFGKKRSLEEQLADEIAKSIDFDDPAQRTGAAVFWVIDKQLTLLKLESGSVPFDQTYASGKCRGALLGTATGIALEEYEVTDAKDIIDAVITAFVVVFGEVPGRRAALDTMQEASDGDADVCLASDWAIKDTRGARAPDSPATPIAYYLAVTGKI